MQTKEQDYMYTQRADWHRAADVDEEKEGGAKHKEEKQKKKKTGSKTGTRQEIKTPRKTGNDREGTVYMFKIQLFINITFLKIY